VNVNVNVEGDSWVLKVLARGITNRDILGTNIGTETEKRTSN
jgi:hypothetical protein